MAIPFYSDIEVKNSKIKLTDDNNYLSSDCLQFQSIENGTTYISKISAKELSLTNNKNKLDQSIILDGRLYSKNINGPEEDENNKDLTIYNVSDFIFKEKFYTDSKSMPNADLKLILKDIEERIKEVEFTQVKYTQNSAGVNFLTTTYLDNKIFKIGHTVFGRLVFKITDNTVNRIGKINTTTCLPNYLKCIKIDYDNAEDQQYFRYLVVDIDGNMYITGTTNDFNSEPYNDTITANFFYNTENYDELSRSTVRKIEDGFYYFNVKTQPNIQKKIPAKVFVRYMNSTGYPCYRNVDSKIPYDFYFFYDGTYNILNNPLLVVYKEV